MMQNANSILYRGNVYSFLPECLGYRNYKLFCFGNSVGVREDDTCSAPLLHYSHARHLHSNRKAFLQVFIYYINSCTLQIIDHSTEHNKVEPTFLLLSSFVVTMNYSCSSSSIIFLPYSFMFTAIIITTTTGMHLYTFSKKS